MNGTTYFVKKKEYKWHAAYLKYRNELKVYELLKSKGIECYLPLRLSKRIWSDRVKIIKEPLFSGYIFVKVNTSEYYEVLFTDGVLRYVSFENKPAVIRDCQIDSLKLFLENVNEKIEISTARIHKGCFVKIINGPLKNSIGEVVEMKGKQCLLLRFEPLGYNIHVDLGDNEIEVLTDTKVISA